MSPILVTASIALEVVTVAFGVVGQASELGECVAEVVAVGVDDGRGDRPVVGLGEEHEVGSERPDPAAVLVGDGE